MTIIKPNVTTEKIFFNFLLRCNGRARQQLPAQDGCLLENGK
jgi:hypothetical protein